MAEVLRSDFFWGIVIGLLLSFAGSGFQTWLSQYISKRQRKQDIYVFFADVIKNLTNIIREMDETRDRTRAIHHDYLDLLDVEVGLFGRNREHMVLLPENLRDRVRRFMNECAVKRAEIVNNLQNFYQHDERRQTLLANGQNEDAQRSQEQALKFLANAQSAADRLTKMGRDAHALIDELNI